MKLLTTTVARVIFAIPMIMFGVFHFMKVDKMVGVVPSFLPFPQFFVYLTGAAFILAAIAILIDKMGKIASLLLALMLLIFILTVHLPQGMDGMQGLLKDTMLLAGALMLAGLFDRGQS